MDIIIVFLAYANMSRIADGMFRPNRKGELEERLNGLGLQERGELMIEMEKWKY